MTFYPRKYDNNTSVIPITPAFAQPTGSLGPIGPIGSQGATGVAAPPNWQTILDLDFSAQSNQNLGSDGSYTIDGITWYKRNSSNDASPAEIVNGTGLIITPVDATNYYSNDWSAPALYVQLSNLIPNFSLQTPIRVWAYESSNLENINPDAFNISIENPATQTNYLFRRTNIGGQNLAQAITVNAVDNSIYGQPYSNNALVMSFVNGIGSLECKYMAGVYTGTSFPDITELNHIAVCNGLNFFNPPIAPLYFGLNNQWTFCLNAQRAGSGDTGYAATISRIKIEYIAI